jgi:cytochrome c553
MRSPLAPILALALAVSPLAGCKRGAAAERARIDKLEADVKTLQGEVPDQATVMTFLAYHYTNLWFAVDEENWPLAGFYLNEARKNLSWAVRIVPVRKDQNGADVNVAAIAESLQKGQLNDLRLAINEKDKARAVKAYKEALAGCYGCHEAAGKPFLRPRIPVAPQVEIISFTPGAPLP